MTLSDLLDDLAGLPGSIPLVFATGDGPIAPGYHVTELRRVEATGIDCGGVTGAWREAVLQLLDGAGGHHMTVGKFRGILAMSLERLDGLAAAPLRVEFGHANAGLGMFSVGGVEAGDSAVTIALVPETAVCKPALRGAATGVSSCCGSGQVRVACCA